MWILLYKHNIQAYIYSGNMYKQHVILCDVHYCYTYLHSRVDLWASWDHLCVDFSQEIPVPFSICGQGSADTEGWLCALMYTTSYWGLERAWSFGLEPKPCGYLRAASVLRKSEVTCGFLLCGAVGSLNPQVVHILIVYKHHRIWMCTYGFKINMTLLLSVTSNLFKVLLEKVDKLKMKIFRVQTK